MNLIAIPISGVIVKSLVLAGFGSVPIKSYPVVLLVLGGFAYIGVPYAKTYSSYASTTSPTSTSSQSLKLRPQSDPASMRSTSTLTDRSVRRRP